MKEKNSSSKKYVYFGIIVFLWLMLIGTLSFAYFSIVFDNDDKTGADIITGKLSVDFVTGEYINNSSMWPINDSDVLSGGDKSVFSVTRSSDNTVDNVYYIISLGDIVITENYKSADIKWSLYDTASPTSETAPISSGSFADLNTDSIQLTQTKISLPKNVTHTYSLFIWISNSEENNQTQLLNGQISGTINITAVTE
jgi:hypothetical protein